MKIALVCPASLPATQFGGILFLCVDIAKESSNIGHYVTIYTTDLDFANNPNTFNKKLPRSEMLDNFEIKRSHVWFSLGLFFVNPGMYFQMIKDNPNVIHSIGIRSFQSFVAALISRRKKIPLVISDQGGLTTHPDLKNSTLVKKILYKLQTPMIRFVINQAMKISVANEYEEEIFSKLVDKSKIVIVRNGINVKSLMESKSIEFKQKYNLKCDYFLFLGRFSKIKGIDILLHAINLIKNTHEMSNTILVIMGVDFGFQTEMFDMIDKFKIQNKVIVIKNPPREDVIAAYKNCKFLVLPSRWELSPLTPLEGFVFKKPVISTNTHGIPYTIENGKNGILVELENPRELSKAIIELLTNNKKCIEYGNAGYNMVINEYNSKKMVSDTLKIYEEVANR